MDLSNENVIHINKNGIEFLQFRRLLEYSDIISHAYTLGVKEDYRTSTVEKKPLPNNIYNNNMKNYQKICDSIGSNYLNIVQAIQKHTKNVMIVEGKVNSNKPDLYEIEYDGFDGLVTNKNSIILSTTNADCILLLFFDPVNKVIANVHSGWKGTIQRMSVEAVKIMINEYNSKPEDIICCICPSIRQCHFEVDKDVKDMFKNEFKNLADIGTHNNLLDKIIKQDLEKNKWYIDTVLINRVLLNNIGLKDNNIIDCGICSVCNSDIIHSYRVEKESYGVETALIELKN